MTQNRYYSSSAPPTTLASSLGSSGNPSVAAVTGLPSSYPFTVLIDWGLTTQEAISVTSVPTGTGPYALPCTRGIDGTTAQAHSAGAVAVHGVTAEDFNEPQLHISGFTSGTSGTGSAQIHGLASGSSVVGTTDTQTLTNKSLTSPALTGTPVAPTASALTDSTQVATTAYTDAAVAVETSRAETAEALALPKAGGTMSGAIAMGSNKVTGLTNGSGAQDAAAYGQTPAGGNTVTIAEGGTGQTGAAAAYNALSPMTTTGDLEYESGTGTAARLAGNTSATKNFLTQTGSGSASAAPAWGTIAAGDLPAGTTSAQGALQLDGTGSDIQPTSTAAAAGSKGQAADAKHVHVQNYGGIFGDGSDGSATLDGTATVSWASKSGSTYTMTRDCLCTSLTVNTSVTLQPSGYRIFCQGTLSNAGTITATGTSATGTSGAGNGNWGTLKYNGPGGNGAATGAAGAGSAAGTEYGTGNSGAGGAGTTGSAGAGQASRSIAPHRSGPAILIAGISAYAGSNSQVSGGPGGGGGAGDGTNSGGGGGAGGGIIGIVAWAVTNTGTITVAAGNGFTPTTGNCGGGGGGGGGLILAYTLSAWTAGTTSVAGGTQGSGVGTGSAGTAGTSGTVLNMVLQ